MTDGSLLSRRAFAAVASLAAAKQVKIVFVRQLRMVFTSALSWQARHTHILVALLLAGCATSTISVSDAKPLPPGEGIVFGRVRVISEGKVVAPSLFSTKFRLFLINNATPKPVTHSVTGDGSFYWHLSPGAYAIAGFKWGDRSGRVAASFKGPEAGTIDYLGTLTITFRGGRYSIRVDDEFDEALPAFTAKFPHATGDPLKIFMQLEAQP